MGMKEDRVKIAVCDDETWFADHLKLKIETLANEYEWLVQVDAYDQVDDFIKSDIRQYQILFLDVRMGSQNGIQIAKELRRQQIRAILIYVSAYIEMAPQGYEVHAFRYLLKQDLERSLPYTLREVMEESAYRRKTYEIHAQGRTELIPLKDIIYIESFKRIAVFHTKKRCSKEYKKLSDLEEELKGANFIRIHKNYLVNLDHIAYIEKGEIHMDNDESLRCSKEKYEEIIQEYVLWKGKQTWGF